TWLHSAPHRGLFQDFRRFVKAVVSAVFRLSDPRPPRCSRKGTMARALWWRLTLGRLLNDRVSLAVDLAHIWRTGQHRTLQNHLRKLAGRKTYIRLRRASKHFRKAEGTVTRSSPTKEERVPISSESASSPLLRKVPISPLPCLTPIGRDRQSSCRRCVPKR